MNKNDNDLLFAAKNVLWKLSHNHDLPDYKGPARIDRKDATIRMLQEVVDEYENTETP